ncbi:MAG: DUF2240 family protein [Methanomicrobiaceae archaeon]|uniref:DUF2240 family protein n=1 Tax=hydrocarbon metagenome TaxID=938273 RepID=A0A0W8FFD9_9ZZZZ|nr:DUF2240 family protein [Methanomicrobiaceae archaeon]MDD5419067.1 DUF2240 family protein [Methanomicrobiaceae archaeon]
MSLKIVVAAPFRHMRKERLQKSEFIFYLSIDRKWMNRDQAALLLDRARERGLVEYSEGWITPLFDVSEVTLPLGFRPGSDIFEDESPAEALIGRIAAATGMTDRQVVAEMNPLITDQFDGNLRVEAAAVLIAKKYGVPFEDLLDALAESVGKKNRV